MDHDKRRARQALRNYKRMLALEPSHTGHLEQIARLLVELGDARQAARYFLQRADVLEARDEPAAALASVRAALECDPHNSRARDMLALLRRTAPPDEILLPEGEDSGLLPVNDALLATDDPILRSDGIELEDDESFMRDAFLPRSSGRPRSLPPRSNTPRSNTPRGNTARGNTARSGAPRARPARDDGDDLSSVVARLSAGLSRAEPSAGPPPAALGDDGPSETNELLSDLSAVDHDRLAGESTRDFTVEQVDDMVVGEATLENRVGRLVDESLDGERGVYDRYAPEPLTPSTPPAARPYEDGYDRAERGRRAERSRRVERPDRVEQPRRIEQAHRFEQPRRGVELDDFDHTQMLTSGEIEVLGELGDDPLDVVADQVIEIRPDSGALPELEPRGGDRAPDRRASDRRAADRRAVDGGPRDEQPTPNVRRGAPVDRDAPTLDRRPDPGVSADTDLDLPTSTSLEHDYAAYRREQLSRPVEARFHAGELRLSSLFAALPRPLLDDLIADAEHRTVRIGVPIVRAGDRFEGPFIVTRGRVTHETDGDNRRRARLHPTEPGDLFGLVELVRGGRWRATARAELECDILRLPVRAVDEARGDHPRWEQTLRDAAGRRLADHLLAASTLFGHIEPGLRTTLGRKFEMRMFGSGEQLIEPGERIDGLYLVIAGEVDVEQDDAYLTTLGAGDLVGIVAALEKAPTRVRAVAATPVEAFYLGADALRLALDVPEVRAAFTAAVDRRRTVLEGGQY